MRDSSFALFLLAAIPSADPTGAERARQLASQAEPDVKVVQIETTPTTQGCNLLQYKLPNEVRLAPYEAIYFAIPDSIRANPLVFMVVGHRQNPRDQRGETEKEAGRDRYPGLTLTGIWNETTSEWRTPKSEWSSGGKIPAKFAETRHSPEKDAIFDIGKLGSLRASDGGGENKDPLFASVARILSMGKDPIYISEFSIRTYPGDSTEDEQKVFSKGTVFSKNAFTMDDDRYGGGNRYGGTYPGALKLRKDGEYAIPAHAGKILREIMVKLGDAHPDGRKNDDGHLGSHGSALFTILIRHADGTESVLMNRDNVGPQGTFRVSPLECDYVAKEGDQIILRSEKDTTYIMGINIRYAGGK